MQPTREVDFLLSCSRSFAGTCDTADVVKSARRIDDWNAVMNLARVHDMEPLVAWQLKGACSQGLDPAFLGALSEVLYYNTAKYLRLTSDLIGVLRVFQAERIPVVSVKGPILADGLCDEFAWRDSCDLDLLVRHSDITRAKEALMAVGYRLGSQLPSGEETAPFHWRSQLVLLRDRFGPAIDLHWQLLPSWFPCARYFHSVWERVQIAAFHGQEVLVLSVEDQLFFLCAHAARHSWETLRLVVDIARLIHTSPELDWKRAIRAGCDNDSPMVLALGLWMVNRLLQIDLPEPAAEYVEATVAGRMLAHDLSDRLLTRMPGQYATLSGFRLQFTLATGWWSKLRCAAGHALLPSDADGQSWRLPPSLFFLYYLYRPIRLTLKYAAEFHRRIFRT